MSISACTVTGQWHPTGSSTSWSNSTEHSYYCRSSASWGISLPRCHLTFFIMLNQIETAQRRRVYGSKKGTCTNKKINLWAWHVSRVHEVCKSVPTPVVDNKLLCYDWYENFCAWLMQLVVITLLSDLEPCVKWPSPWTVTLSCKFIRGFSLCARDACIHDL